MSDVTITGINDEEPQSDVSGDELGGGESTADSGGSEPSTSLVSILREKGYEFDDGTTDDEVLSEIEEYASRRDQLPSADEIERLKKLEPAVADYAQHAADFQKWKESQQKQPEPEQKQAQPEPIWNPPKVDDQVDELIAKGVITQDPKTGLYATEMPQLQSYADQANKRQQYAAKFFGRFRDNPVEFIGDLVKPLLSERDAKIAELEERLGEGQKRIEASDFEMSRAEFFEQHRDKFFVEQDGQLQQTKAGDLYAKTYEKLREKLGEKEAHELAVDAASELFEQPKQVDAKPANKQEKRRQFLKRAKASGEAKNTSTARVPNRVADVSGTTNRRRSVPDYKALIEQAAAELQ